MLEKMKAIEARLAEVERQLSDPTVYTDRERLTALSREQKELTPIAACARAYAQTAQTAEDACAMLSDPELRELAQEELSTAKAEMERLTEELKRLLLPKDPNDDKNVILEIRAGIGGEEGALFAADLLRMYTMYAERKGWTLSIVNENDTELGGVKEVSAEVEGAGAWSRLKFEAGTASSAYRKRSPPAASRPLPPLWPSCRRQRKWSLPSTPRICRSTRSVPPVPAASTSIRQSLPSASPTCPPVRWWNVRTSAASIRTRTAL